ncbi:aminotransferase class I/II-fold pyridoxal phosphate-dependent enzyme [Paramaledivibacter caminithermalis]|uniref:Arginine decarboxylase n=1 Tax=Paramaledivibacter caminithermalis (strain DSM 15212 / CIP 107654 / DViRD3) TaxID=1121301 RepID=A0A1M6QAK1_PARC5|nr:aminotransferase class I/II-fold pyridoxal phosphate-dependent enzyme [Paramaledivibacter caminithermalis]SHK17324.1 arginine decarboxylase [Paramaledivibacter caminithermalis DSM 15212]
MKKPVIVNELKKLSKRNMVSFHVPGHKSGKIFERYNLSNFHNIGKFDITEIPGADNLYAPEGMIKEAQERAKEFYGGDYTFFLINGTTCGVISMIMAATNPGDKIIVSRDCHKAIISGMILGGVMPIYIKPKICYELFLSMAITPKTIERAIKENPDAKAVVITYPNYYGVCSDIEKIAEIVHKYDKVLLVDEAHGAHLKLSENLPISALDAGADIVVHSTHKTLPSFTQSSMLHVKGKRIDIDKLKTMLSLTQSSSPSYLLMLSLDMAMTVATGEGKYLMEKLIDNIEDFRKEINKIEGLNIFSKEIKGKYGVKDIDITKITINMKEIGIDGIKLEEILRKKYNIQVEMADMYNILAVSSIANDRNDFNRFARALEGIYNDKRVPHKKSELPEFSFAIPKMEVLLREATYRKKKSIPFSKSSGKISGEYIIPYPPGIPLICPGEVISQEIIEYVQILKNIGINIIGTCDESINTINVIK